MPKIVELPYIEVPAGEEVEIRLPVRALAAPVPEPPALDVSGLWKVSAGGQSVDLNIRQRGITLEATYDAIQMVGAIEAQGFRLSGQAPLFGTLQLVVDTVEGAGEDQQFSGRIFVNGQQMATATGVRPKSEPPPPPPPPPSDDFEKAFAEAQPGDTVVIPDGRHELSATLRSVRGGTPEKPIVVKAIGEALLTGNGTLLHLSHPHIYIQNIVFDGEFRSNERLVEIRSGANYVSLSDCVVVQGKYHGVDIDSVTGATLSNTEIAYMLAGSSENRIDAHGVAVSRSLDILIDNCNIHHVSGDCVQTDRAIPLWDNLFLGECHLWTGPLFGDSAGWMAGEIPGENALDTKSISGGRRPLVRISGGSAHGFVADPEFTNRAALNLKSHVTVEIGDGFEVYNNEIGFRVRGATDERGGAYVLIDGAEGNGNDILFRCEDGIERLEVANSAFSRPADGLWFKQVSGGYLDSGLVVDGNTWSPDIPPEEAGGGTEPPPPPSGNFVIFNPLQSQSDVNSASVFTFDGAGPGDANFPHYDATQNALCIPIIDGRGLGQCIQHHPFVQGEVWTTIDCMLDDGAFHPAFNGLGSKYLRWGDDQKRGNGDERRLTQQMSYGEGTNGWGNTPYWRDGGGLANNEGDREVRMKLGPNDYDYQPGGDTANLRNNRQPHPACFRVTQPYLWVQYVTHLDFSGNRLEIWGRHLPGGPWLKVIDFDNQGPWNSQMGVEWFGAVVQATSRNHGNWPSGLPTAKLYFRNLGVSRQPLI